MSIRTGFFPIEIAGYRLPGRDEAEKIDNRDVYAMAIDDCMAELAKIDAATAERERLRAADHVRDVIILKERGATSFEEWATERREAIAKRVMYGR